MQEDYISERSATVSRGQSSGKFLALALVIALVLGGAMAIWAGNRLGWIDVNGPDVEAPAKLLPSNSPVAAGPLATPTTAPLPANPAEGAQAALGVRLAELETRIAQLNLQAEAASGNAARAEGLLIAFAARRTIERGSPLGYLEGQLKLRFANAQPNAVESLIEASANPVTLDMLEQGLHALEPELARGTSATDTWSRVREQFANLFVVRRVDSPSPAPERRLERARMFLEAGRVGAAVSEIERMPGASAAAAWLDQANHYVRTQRALDLIETAAILEPRTLGDESGEPVATPSPLAAPVEGDPGAF